MVPQQIIRIDGHCNNVSLLDQTRGVLEIPLQRLQEQRLIRSIRRKCRGDSGDVDSGGGGYRRPLGTERAGADGDLRLAHKLCLCGQVVYDLWGYMSSTTGTARSVKCLP